MAKLTHEEIVRSHVVTMTTRTKDLPMCRCGASPGRMALGAALAWTDLHHAEVTALVEPTRYSRGWQSDTPAKPRHKPSDTWKAHKAGPRSVVADVFYSEDAWGFNMTFPTRRVLVSHLREFVDRRSFNVGEVVAYGEDRDGRFTCVLDSTWGKRVSVIVVDHEEEDEQAA